MKKAATIISIVLFAMLLPVSLVWGMAKGAWQEAKDLFTALFVW